MKKTNIFISFFVISIWMGINIFGQECLFIASTDTLKDTETNIAQKIEEWGYNITVINADSLANYPAENYETHWIKQSNREQQ